MTRRFWIVLLLVALGLGAIALVSVLSATDGEDASPPDVEEVTGPTQGATPVAR